MKRIHKFYEEKLTDLCDDFHRHDMRQLSNVTRIRSMENRSALRYEEMAELEDLKKSSKKLKAKLVAIPQRNSVQKENTQTYQKATEPELDQPKPNGGKSTNH